MDRGLKGIRNSNGDLIKQMTTEDKELLSNKTAIAMKRVTELDDVLSDLNKEKGLERSIPKDLNEKAIKALDEQYALLYDIIKLWEQAGLEPPEALVDKYKYLNIY